MRERETLSSVKTILATSTAKRLFCRALMTSWRHSETAVTSETLGTNCSQFRQHLTPHNMQAYLLHLSGKCCANKQEIDQVLPLVKPA